MEPKTVMFEHIRNWELASRLREATRRLEQTLGFGIRIVERAGVPLKNSFTLASLWDSVKCGKDCFYVSRELRSSTHASKHQWFMRIYAKRVTLGLRLTKSMLKLGVISPRGRNKQ